MAKIGLNACYCLVDTAVLFGELLCDGNMTSRLRKECISMRRISTTYTILSENKSGLHLRYMKGVS